LQLSHSLLPLVLSVGGMQIVHMSGRLSPGEVPVVPASHGIGVADPAGQ